MNDFRVTLHQDNILFCERIIDADQFTPPTKSNINIKSKLNKIISNLQDVLSMKSYETTYQKYDMLKYQKNMVLSINNTTEQKISNYKPKPKTQEFGGWISKGVDFRFSFFINDNLVVERVFLVDGFNPDSRWSIDVVNAFNQICSDIVDHLKRVDIKNIWDDYDIISKFGITINAIRELSSEERGRMLRIARK